MRGKGNFIKAGIDVFRITPAYAGKSLEKFDALYQDTGSPPPMRGKAEVISKLLVDHRITPAYAGKSDGLLLTKVESEDHPRLCGEKTKKIPKQRYFFHQPASFSFSLQYT